MRKPLKLEFWILDSNRDVKEYIYTTCTLVCDNDTRDIRIEFNEEDDRIRNLIGDHLNYFDFENSRFNFEYRNRGWYGDMRNILNAPSTDDNKSRATVYVDVIEENGVAQVLGPGMYDMKNKVRHRFGDNPAPMRLMAKFFPDKTFKPTPEWFNEVFIIPVSDKDPYWWLY